MMKYALYEIPRRLTHFIRWTGFFTGCYLWILMILRIRKRVRVEIGGEKLTLRSSTPDIIVASSSLINEEYSSIKSDSPELIIDAGANIGTSAIWFARKFPNATIVAIEPEKENMELLIENTKRFQNIKPMHCALWSCETVRDLTNRQTGEWGYTLLEDVKGGTVTDQKINCVTVNSILEAEGRDQVDILKMDIEGGEKDVLLSANSWIGKINALTVELHDIIIMGCDRAFYLATKDFATFERSGEKVTAYRNN